MSNKESEVNNRENTLQTPQRDRLPNGNTVSPEVSMFLMPTLMPQTILLPNLQPVYCPNSSPELLRMMQMYAATSSQQQLQFEQFRTLLAAQMKEKCGANDNAPQDDYETANIPIISTRSSLHEQAIELTRLALSGCDLGERIAISHQTRPCFKKIDSLCARMKQDLTRPDGVLANVNSQGIAWAVKDFIFVLTRIINGWNIIRGYANNQATAESLDKVRSALSPTFNESFFKWQESTLEFLSDIIQSFLNLDQLVQTQRGLNHPGKNESNTSYGTLNLSNGSNIDDSSNESFSSTNSCKLEDKNLVVENSEEAQMKHMENGTYFKTGVYNPLRADNIKEKSLSVETKVDSKPLSRPDLLQDASDYEKQISDAFNTLKQTLSSNKLENDTVARFLLCKIENFKNAEYFFSSKFIDNYFPDFCKTVPNFIDVRSIILKAQSGTYENIYQIVHDLRQIGYNARIYLGKYPLKFLNDYLQSFERELETILADDTFSKLDFTSITGNPTDILKY